MKEGEDFSARVEARNVVTENLWARFFFQLGEKMAESERALFKFDEPAVRKQVHSLFGAGFTITLRHCLMMMALYPDVQRKLMRSLIVWWVKIDIRNLLTKRICLTLWLYSMSALSLTHATTCDTEFHGYPLAKGTPVILTSTPSIEVMMSSRMLTNLILSGF